MKYTCHQPTAVISGTNIVNGILDIPVSPQQQNFNDKTSLQQNSNDKICFNFGKELYVYSYRGLKKVSI